MLMFVVGVAAAAVVPHDHHCLKISLIGDADTATTNTTGIAATTTTSTSSFPICALPTIIPTRAPTPTLLYHHHDH